MFVIHNHKEFKHAMSKEMREWKLNIIVFITKVLGPRSWSFLNYQYNRNSKYKCKGNKMSQEANHDLLCSLALFYAYYKTKSEWEWSFTTLSLSWKWSFTTLTLSSYLNYREERLEMKLGFFHRRSHTQNEGGTIIFIGIFVIGLHKV